MSAKVKLMDFKNCELFDDQGNEISYTGLIKWVDSKEDVLIEPSNTKDGDPEDCECIVITPTIDGFRQPLDEMVVFYR